jgi:hypothetical protein
MFNDHVAFVLIERGGRHHCAPPWSVHSPLALRSRCNHPFPRGRTQADSDIGVEHRTEDRPEAPRRTIMLMRVKPVVCLLVAAVLAFLPSCSTSATHESDPLQLVGTWRVIDTGERLAPYVSIGDGGLVVWASCGQMMGEWRADQHGSFVGELDGGNSVCFGTGLNPRWLISTVAYRPTGSDELLLNTNGQVAARLVPASVPQALPKGLARSYLHPTMSASIRRDYIQDNGPLQSALIPATPRQLVGRWVPFGVPLDHAPGSYLTLSADGSWTGGCTGGRWAAGRGGALVDVSRPSDLMFCNAVDVEVWLNNTTEAGFQGRTLVLVDAAGDVTGRLRRA